MKKKILSGLLTCAMVFSAYGMAAGAEAEPETTSEVSAETTAEASTEAAAEDGSGTAEDGEALSDNIYDFQFKLDGALYTFPMSFDDFLALGWEYDGDEDLELSPYSYTGELFYKGKLRAFVDLLNNGINTVPYSQCMVSGITIDSFYFEDAPETVIELPKGIVYGTSTLDDVKAAYGEPSDVYEGELYTKLSYEYDSYQDWEFEIDVETGVLNEFDIQNFTYDEEANAAAAAEVSGEPTEEVLAYVAPTELGDDPLSFVVEFAGDLYQLPAPVSVFLENGWTLKTEDSDSVVAGYDFGWLYMMKDNQEFHTLARNYNRNATTIENCFVTTIEGNRYDTDLPVVLPGGAATGMTVAELEAALEGVDYTKDDSNETYVYYNITGKDEYDEYISILVYTDEDLVSGIEVRYYPDSVL